MAALTLAVATPVALETAGEDLMLLQTRAEVHGGPLPKLREQYLSTVRMGLLGGLNHAAFTDPNRGGTTDPRIRSECLNRDWVTNQTIDDCVMKWDANERLLRVDQLYKAVRQQDIPGDVMECGVWRGGVTVYMKALLEAFGDDTRRVWVSDSFNGVPNAARQKDEDNYEVPDDVKEMDRDQWGGSATENGVDGTMQVKNLLTVEHELVRDNFLRFNLLDDSVKFLPGYFNESLPTVSKLGMKKLAILRVDGDLYTSTMDVLLNLYDFVSPGGYVIFDDYPLPQSRRAIEDFFAQKNLDLSLIKTDRITEEANKRTNDNINQNAYFQKPL